MPDAVIFVGLQASGKSSFYQRRFSTTHIRINLDMLRTRNRERELLDFCLDTSMSFVVDNTNPTRKDRARYLAKLEAYSEFKRIGYYFQSRLDDCLERNASREGTARIPDVGLRATYAQLELPQYEEGFDTLWYVQTGVGGEFEIDEWNSEV